MSVRSVMPIRIVENVALIVSDVLLWVGPAIDRTAA